MHQHLLRIAQQPHSWTLDVDIALLANPPSVEALQSPVPSLVHLERVLRLSDWFYDCTPTSQSIASQQQLVEHHQLKALALQYDVAGVINGN